MSITLENTELDELYQLAIKEIQNIGGELTVWAGGDAINQQDELAQKFMEKFPKIPIDIKVELSKDHNIKIYEGLLDGDLKPDVVMLQTSNDFEDWKKMGVLAPFKSQSFSNIREELKDSDGYFSSFRMFAFLPQYAKEGVSQIPTTLSDLLTDNYRGHLISTFPHDDDAVLFVFDQLIKKNGEDFIRKFADAEPQFVRGTAGPPLLVGKNGILGGLTGYETNPNQPSQSFIPEGENDFFISWAQRIAMFKLTKHKAAAKLFIAFTQSTSFQESLGKYTVRKDIIGEGEQWIGSYKNTNPEGFFEFMRDRKHINDLRQLMTNYFGPVYGESPLVDHKMIKLTYGWPTY